MMNLKLFVELPKHFASKTDDLENQFQNLSSKLSSTIDSTAGVSYDQQRIGREEQERIDIESRLREREEIINASRNAREKAFKFEQQENSEERVNFDRGENIIPGDGNVHGLASKLFGNNKPAPEVVSAAAEPVGEVKEYQAAYDFAADQADDLGFSQGDVIVVTVGKTDASGDWWYGKNKTTNREGWFGELF